MTLSSIIIIVLCIFVAIILLRFAIKIFFVLLLIAACIYWLFPDTWNHLVGPRTGSTAGIKADLGAGAHRVKAAMDAAKLK